MKSATVAASILAFVATSEACVRVHSYLDNDPVTGDSMHLQIYEGSDLICEDDVKHYFASDDTEWKLKCDGDGYSYEAKLKDNGKSGTIYKHHTSWEKSLKVQDSYTPKPECKYKTGLNERCTGYISTMEYLLVDDGGDCSSSDYKLEVCKERGCNIADGDPVCVDGGDALFIGGISLCGSSKLKRDYQV